jgi:glycolate oxidase
VPVKGGLVLDLVKLNRIKKLYSDEPSVEVEAGIVWKRLMDQLSGEGYTVLSYPTSAPSSTVGGWISTGGYGIGSLKFGYFGEQIAELEVVSPQGRIQRLTSGSEEPEMKWFFGTEGVLGVITSLKFKIRRKPEKTAVCALYSSEFETVANLLSSLAKAEVVPYLLKFMDRELVELKNQVSRVKIREENFLLAAYEGPASEVTRGVNYFGEEFRKAKAKLAEENVCTHEWEERFNPMRISRLGPTLLAGEVVVPLNRLSATVGGIKLLQKKYGIKLGVEGYVVSRDSALVMAVFLTDERKTLKYTTQFALIKDITDIGLRQGGSPYGIGLWNSFYAAEKYGTEYFEELKRVKKKLDPRGIMNPGKFFEASTRFGFPIPPRFYRLSMAVGALVNRLI